MKVFCLYLVFGGLFFQATTEALQKSLDHRCSIGLVPLEYCQKQFFLFFILYSVFITMTNEKALIQALVLAVTAPSEDKSKECQFMAATFIDLIDDDDIIEACYKKAEAILNN